MILTAKKILVPRHRAGQMDFMAGRAELSLFMEWLQKRFLMEFWLGLDELIIDPLQHIVFTACKRIVNRFFDRVVRIATRAIDVGDRMTCGAGDACLRSKMSNVIKLRIVKSATEKWYRIVTARAPA